MAIKLDRREFPRKIVLLKKKVENITGKKLVIREGPMTIGANETLMSKMENGIPTIIVKSNYTPTNEEIYHELFHLYIKSKLAIHSMAIDGNLMRFLREKNYDNLGLILSKTHSVLQHSFFFKKMISEGYHPTKYLEEQLKNRLNGYPNNSYVPSDSDTHVMLDIWHLALGKADRKSEINDLLEVLKERHPKAYIGGTSLFKISKNFSSPSAEPEVLIKILKKLFGYRKKINYKIENKTVIYS